MRPMLKLILHHPAKLGVTLVLISLCYEYARILVLQYIVGVLQYSIHRYPNNFPPGFFIPFFYISITVAFFAAIYQDFVVLEQYRGWWKYVLPIPLTLQGRLYRIIGVPVYACVLGVIEAIQFFRNPSMDNDLGRLAKYFETIPPHYKLLDETTLRQFIADIKWQAWTVQTTNPTMWSYVRLPMELFGAFMVCLVYGLAMFCNEPRHDGEELREATRNNDADRVRVILKRGVNPNSQASDGATALHICAQQAIPAIARILLYHQADSNHADRLGFTPLHWAVQMRREEMSSANRLEMIRLLVQHGADPKKSGPNGITPWAIASKKENASSLEVLNEVFGEHEETNEREATSSATSPAATTAAAP